MDLDALIREMEQAEGAEQAHTNGTQAAAASVAESSSEWERRLQRAKEQERQLKQQQAKRPASPAGAASSSSSKYAAEKHLFTLRKHLQRAYAELIASDVVRAVAADVEQSLWKSCIYKPIEALRKLLRVATPNASAKRYPEQLARYAKLYAFCARFLDDACAYFERAFFERLPQSGWEAIVDEHRNGSKAAAASSNPQLWQMQLRPVHAPSSAAVALREASLHSCHRCLLFRGDLERYKQLMLHDPAALKWIAAAKQQQQSDAPLQSWTRVAFFYHQAITLQPGVGAPWNQLAVLSTYENESLAAVSYYIRALTCHEPFATAQINLQLLLEKQRDAPLLLRHPQQHAGLEQSQSSLFPQHPVCSFFAACGLDALWLLLFDLLSASSTPHPHLAALPCVAAAVTAQFVSWIGRSSGESKALECMRSMINLMFLCEHSAPTASPPSTVHQAAVSLAFELVSAMIVSIRSVHQSRVGVVVQFLRWLQLHLAFLHESLVPLPVRQAFWGHLAQLVNSAASHLASPTAQEGAPIDEHALLPEQQHVLGCALFQPALPVASSSSASPHASLLLGQPASQPSSVDAAVATDADDDPMAAPHSATRRRCAQLVRLAASFVTQRVGLEKQGQVFRSLLDSPPISVSDPPSSLPALEPAASPARLRSSAAPHAAAAAAALALASSPARGALVHPTIGPAPSSSCPPPPAADTAAPHADSMQDVEPPLPVEMMEGSSSAAPALAAPAVPSPSSRSPVLSSVSLSAGSLFVASYARLHFPQFALAE